MVKRVFAGIFSFIFASIIASIYGYMYMAPIIMGSILPFPYYILLIGGYAGIATAIAGGVFAILGKSKGFILMWVALQVAACPIAFIVNFSGVLSEMVTWVKAFVIIGSHLPLVLGVLALILSEKPKNTLAYVTELISVCGTLILGIYSIFHISLLFSLIFMGLGLLGLALMITAIIIAHDGRALNFTLTLLSGLCQAAQFIAIITASGIIGGIAPVILAVVSVIMTAVGSILVAYNLEIGFITLSFGIIALLVLLFLFGIMIERGFAIVALVTVLGLAVQLAEILIMRAREKESLAKPI